MDPPNLTLRRLATLGGYLLVGLLGTAGITLGVLAVSQPFQPPIYHIFYPIVGPWTATETATVVVVTGVAAFAIAVPPAAVQYFETRGEHLPAIGTGFSAIFVVMLGVLVVSALVDAIGLLVAIVTVAAAVIVGGYGLDEVGARPGLVALVGGVPVLLVVMFLLGFGLGWGGGYDVVARPVADASVNGTVVAMDDSPAIRDALFSPSACRDDGICRLPLRGSDHEARVARWLDRNGVRCRFLNAPPGSDNPARDSFLAEHDGTVYRVSCLSYGD